VDSDTQVRLAIYQHFATTGRAPAAGEIADRLGVAPSLVLTSYQRLRAARVLFLEPDGQTIRMAPPSPASPPSIA